MKEITVSETKRMFDVVYETVSAGGSVNKAFSLIAAESGKSVGSVRNYYYAQLRLMRMLPKVGEQLGVRLFEGERKQFEQFTAEEISSLIEDVLVGRVSGKSVRAILIERAGGDKKKYLRDQNKYRSLVARKRREVYDVLARLNKEKRAHYDPFTKKTVCFTSLSEKEARLVRFLEEMGEKRRNEILSAVKG